MELSQIDFLKIGVELDPFIMSGIARVREYVSTNAQI
jgi:hypothetical protein